MGLESMRTVRTLTLTIRMWHVWMVQLVLCFAAWSGIFMLGFYARNLLGGMGMSLEIKLLILLVTCGGLLFGGYFSGRLAANKNCELAKAQAVQRSIDQAASVAKQDAAVSTGQEQTRERVRTVYRTITKEVEKNVAKNPDYLHCGLDADGLRLWNDANAGDPVDGPGQRDAGLPGLTAGGRWKLGHPVQESPGSSGAVPGMPGAEPGQGGDHPQP